MTDVRYSFREHPAGVGEPTLLLVFHSTGGDENQFFGLGRDLMPAAHLIAPRGDVSENGMPRFFRRKAEGVYDMADLEERTRRMAGFVRAQAERIGASRIAGLGYSNGANILASVIFADPTLFDAAVLMHPLIPWSPPPRPELTGRRVLVTAGRHDPICPPQATERLVEWLTAQGVATTLKWHAGGHEVRQNEIDAARIFFSGVHA